MAKSSIYRLGSIWLVTFDPSVGTKIRKTRPALIISDKTRLSKRLGDLEIELLQQAQKILNRYLS